MRHNRQSMAVPQMVIIVRTTSNAYGSVLMAGSHGISIALIPGNQDFYFDLINLNIPGIVSQVCR